MKLWSKIAAASLLVLGLASFGHAQDDVVNPLLPTQGTREIAFGGNFMFEPTDSYNIFGSYGPFLNPQTQVGGTLGFAKAGSVSSISYGVFGNYHFPSASATLPYVGIFLGGQNTDVDNGKDTNSTAYGIHGGIKHFLNANVAVFGELQYRDTNTKNVDATVNLQFGLATYLR